MYSSASVFNREKEAVADSAGEDFLKAINFL
jgi:hypothetical protein